MKYEVKILSNGYPLKSIESDNLIEILSETNKAKEVLHQNGNRDLEVKWEKIPVENLIIRNTDLMELIEIRREFQEGDRKMLGYFTRHFIGETKELYDGYTDYELVEIVNDTIINTIDMIGSERA